MKTVLAILSVFLGATVPCLAAVQVQEPDLPAQARPGGAPVDGFLERAVGVMGLHPNAITDCSNPLKGTLVSGTPVSSYLGDSVTCYSSGVYIDLWLFTASAGQQVTVSFTSTPSILATIQDYGTGTVLTSSASTCGGLATSCTFTYSAPSSAQYYLGIGAYSTGSYTLTVSSGGAPPGGQSNLTPYKPSGWSDKIVVATVQGTTTDATQIGTTDTLYVDYAIANLGTASTGVGYTNTLYLDGNLIRTGSAGATDVNHYVFANDVVVNPLPAGTHTLRVVADSTNVVAESNEADNEYTKTFTVTASTPSSCTSSGTVLCLNGNRFAVSVSWTTPSGRTGEEQSIAAAGSGQAVGLTGDTGYFWFFSSNNVEMVIKVVDGRAVNNRFWVFAGGLTNVNVVIQVTDTLTGTVRTYTNPQGAAFQPIQDTNAFPG
jgi:hypothetical protein